ncbi:MAG TPA: aldehyde dehydrogenase family protein [Solirubrobacteraceae bacterium]|nr:aldehyde dehydrogenase family protein [Solirubrobacteraceae bacterium]
MEASTGAQLSTGDTIVVTAPATGEKLGEVPVMDAAAVAEKVQAARAAQPAWQELGFEGRAAIFHAAQKWLIANSQRMLDTICSENGKTFEDGQVELSVAAGSFAFWAKHAAKYLADEKLRSTSPLALGRKVLVRYSPVGVVGVIGPWNYPLVNLFCDAVPALMAGNSVVLKPSEVTPLTALLTAEMMKESGLPDGVLQVVTGVGPTAEALIDEVDFIMFTGSTATGKKVMARAAQTLTPVSLELGGKDPMIVCADADVDRAANAATTYAMNNSGQVCISVERVYVEQPIYDSFVAKVLENVGNLRQGPPAGPGEVEVGAITGPGQIDIIDRHVSDARDRGASVIAGGHRREGDGRFYEPTVLVGVDHTMQCMTEETFGPTLPIMRVDSVDDAVRLANDSPYGLQASVFTKDPAKAEAIARRLEAGSVTVNDSQLNYTVFNAPMGGWKSSGLGSRHGATGIRKYCQVQTILFSPTPAMKRDLHMFPYTPRKSKLLGKLIGFLYGR